MTALVVLSAAFAVAVVVVTVCATLRPEAAEAIATALRGLASVFAAVRPGRRR